MTLFSPPKLIDQSLVPFMLLRTDRTHHHHFILATKPTENLNDNRTGNRHYVHNCKATTKKSPLSQPHSHFPPPGIVLLLILVFITFHLLFRSIAGWVAAFDAEKHTKSKHPSNSRRAQWRPTMMMIALLLHGPTGQVRHVEDTRGRANKFRFKCLL